MDWFHQLHTSPTATTLFGCRASTFKTTCITSSITWTLSLNFTRKCQTGEAMRRKMLAGLYVPSWLHGG